MLDYDKKFLLCVVRQPDVRRLFHSRLHRAARERSAVVPRLGSFYWAPADVFGPGKVLVFADVISRTGSPYVGDIRGKPQATLDELFRRRTATRSMPPTRSRAFSSRASTPSAAITKPASSSTSTPAATIIRLPGDPLRTFIDYGGGSSTRDGISKREGPSRGRAVAVRDQLRLRRGRRRRRPDPALQADLPPSRDASGYDGELLAQAGRRRERQRHAHQRVDQQGRTRISSGIRRAKRTSASLRGSSWTAS